jgi:hypothetical protein
MQEKLLALGHLSFRAESWADWGGNVGIEYRFPLLDKRVVEFALGAPDWLYFRNGWKRYAFRKALEGFVPAPGRWKKSKGDPAMVRGAAQLVDPALELFRDRLAARESAVRAAGLIDWETFVAGYAPLGPAPDPGQLAARHDSARSCWIAFTDARLP